MTRNDDLSDVEYDHGVRTDPYDGPTWELIERPTDEEPLLSVRDLKTRFNTEEGAVKAVDGVNFDIYEGEILGLVGESGCGKSATSRSLMRLIRSPGSIEAGEIRFNGKDLLELSNEEIRRIRGNEMTMIFQEPMSAFNPVFDVGWQVGEPLRVHENLKKNASRKRAIQLLEEVGIPSPEVRVDDYPHEYSGGMLQRGMIAMALACQPDLLIADEPTTALDVTIEAQILDLINEFNEERGMSVLLVTHDLGVVAQICDKVAVMYSGRIVEYGSVQQIFNDPRHPYTRGLMNCVPDPTADRQDLRPIEGEVSDLITLPEGCNFQDRCPFSDDECGHVDPDLREVAEDHYSACIWKDPS